MRGSGHLLISDNPDYVKWDLFVRNHPSGNIFQSVELFRAYQQVSLYKPAVLCLLTDEGDVEGILLYTIIREPGFKSFFSARSLIMGGPLVTNNNPGLCDRLIKEYLRVIARKHVIFSEIRNLWVYPEIRRVMDNNNFTFAEHLNIFIDLNQPEDALENQLHPKRLSNIRRVKKKNLKVEPATESDLTAVDYLIRKTYKRINVPGPPSDLFLSLQNSIPANTAVFVIRQNDQIIACRIYLLYNRTMYDWYAGSNREYRGLHPNDLLPWECLLWGKAKGFVTYDFGGAGKPGLKYGVREYKKRFGGEMLNTGRYQFVHNRLLFFIGKIGMKFYKLIQ